MTTEDRLRDALHGEAASIEPRDGWAAIESRLDTATVPRNRSRYLMAAAAAALVLAAAVAVIAQQNSDKRTVVTNPGDTSTTTPPTTRVEPAVALGPHLGILWSHSFDTPREAASGFARDFLGMTTPDIGEFQAGDNRSGEVVVRPKATGGPVTTVALREFDGQWYVMAANADNLEVDSPETLSEFAPTDKETPLHVSGRSVAFEGHVNIAVLDYDTVVKCEIPGDDGHACAYRPGVKADTFFTGHGTEKGPFATDVSLLSRPTGTYGYVVLWTRSAEDGSMVEATVRLIRFKEPRN
jgi:hypothetical protein